MGGVFIYHNLKGGDTLSAASHRAGFFSFHNKGGFLVADDKKTISPDVGTPTEVPEQPNPAPDLADATAPAPLGPEALTVEEQLILEHEGQAALFEMGEAIPDVSEFPGLTIPEQPESDKDNKQPPTPGKDDPAPAHSVKVVDFAAARDEAAKEEKKAVK